MSDSDEGFMVNLKSMFEAAATKNGEQLVYAVVGPHDDDVFESRMKQFIVEPWAEASKKLDYEYDNGYGGADCHAVIAWGEKFVYFVSEYDGATGVQYVPRNPEPCTPTWSGVG